MARTNATNYTGVNQFPRADAATDLFKKEDVQVLALAVDNHDHTNGKGLPMAAGSIPNGTITSAMIADGTIDTADLKDGSVTSAKILDGTLATADHADASVTNAKLGPDTARANLLTNGGFEVWQRGVSGFGGAGVYNADRWIGQSNAGQGVFNGSIARDSANADGGSQYCWTASNITGASAGGPCSLEQQVEGYFRSGQTLSFSVRVKTSVANMARLAFIDPDGTTTNYSTYHPGNGAYATLTITRTLASSGPKVYARVMFDANGAVFVDNANLVVGTVPADYAPLHPADDLARCLRYYDTVGGELNAPCFSGYNTAGGDFFIPIIYRVPKPVTPTVTKNGTWTTNNCGQPTFFSTGLKSSTVQITATATGLMTARPADATCTMAFEANP